MSFWVRFSNKDPKSILPSTFRSTSFWYLAGVTEGQDWTWDDINKFYVPLFVTWYDHNNAFNRINTPFMGTYNGNSRADLNIIPYPEDIEAGWIFYYVGASHK